MACLNVTVVIVNFNSGDNLWRCLNCLSQQTENPRAVIIVDNGSDDDSISKARDRFPNFKFIEVGSNLGFAAANNFVFSLICTDYVALLNPDAFPEPTWLANLVLAASKLSTFDSFASCQIMDMDRGLLDGAGDSYHISGLYRRRYYGCSREVLERLPDYEEVFSACAGAAMYRASALRAVGGFDEMFFCYGEDVDLGFRMRLLGGRCVFVKNAIVLHIGSAVTGKGSDFSVYYGHRNAEWVWLKNMPFSILVLSFPFRVLMFALTLVHFYSKGQHKVFLKAKRDALAMLPTVLSRRSSIQRSRSIDVLKLLKIISFRIV
jgi:GT2 family glycosyltransferase